MLRSALALVTVTCCAMPSAAEEPLRMVRIATDAPGSLAAELHEAGFDVEHGHTYHGRDGGGVEIVVTADEQARLIERGLAVRVVRVGRPLKALDAGRGIPSGYGDLDWIYQQMHAAAARRPDICEVVDLTARYGKPPTHEGRHLFAVRISDNVGQDEAEPAVLIVANHHAREIGTPIVALRTIDNLVDGHGTDPRITASVDDHEIWIAPTWNPDGYQYVYDVDDFWRKNRRDNQDGSRGVDLNRNYPVGWGQCGGSTYTGSSIYQGPSAASEPETQTMLALAEDRRFARVADVHSYASEVRYGYGCWDHPWDPSFGQVAAGLSQLSGYGGDTRSSCCLGGDIHLHTNRYGAMSFLWEIGTSFHPTFASANAEADVLWNAMLELIDRGSAISGRVTRAGSEMPVGATVTVVGAGFTHGESHGSAPRHGLFHAHPPLGTWTVRFEADGYQPAERTVTLTSVMPQTELLVELTPECTADLAEPFGVLNFFDLSAYLALFNAQDPAADLAGPAGVFNFFDVAAYIAAYNAGCP